ncbi:Endoribonuclease YbeY [Planctomycetes bacterium Pan216]|uniref:Endoribonuclease YbeY n=1 Tax=Kolteria novifilia TaxID=2527975 RepID=A0A518B888_9BACT|nr:Endoribonuclease YbeY [Planctomycetes bacterium Pan216]
MINVDIADRQDSLGVDDQWFVGLAQHVLEAQEVSAAEISIALVGDQESWDLNRRYLEHDFPTDVITFPLSEPGEPLHGELVVNTDYARRSSEDYDWSAFMELGLYVVHGILHLCGYDDHEESDAAAMSERQQSLLHAYHEKTGRDGSRSSSLPTNNKGHHSLPE